MPACIAMRLRPGTSLSAHSPPARTAWTGRKSARSERKQRLDAAAGPHQVVGAPGGVIAADTIGPIRHIAIIGIKSGCEVGDVAQSQIEALRSDRRKGMRRLADKRHAVLAGRRYAKHGQRKDHGGAGHVQLAEQVLALFLERCDQIALAGRVEHARRVDPHQDWPCCRPPGTSVNGPCG